jgi:phage shock protein A
MALLGRVSTLIRANLNDLIDKAEEPEKMMKQVILDIENQLIQVKTQLAMALADRHLLEKKRREVEEKAAEWVQKAELAVDKGSDDLARAALERSLEQQKMAESLKLQEADQSAQAEILKTSLKTLGAKLAEAQAKRDALAAERRRSRALHTAEEPFHGATLQNSVDTPSRSESMRKIRSELAPDDVEQKFASLEREDQVNRLLAEIKNRRRPQA